MGRPATTKIRCPKCRSRTFTFVESGEWTSSFEVTDGRLDRAEGYHEPGCMLRLEAQCPCGHHWKVRGAIQITDAVTEIAPSQPKDSSHG